MVPKTQAKMNDPCSLLLWDSDFFGFRIAQVQEHTLDPGKANEVNFWCQQNSIRCLYFLSNADDIITTRTAEQDGYHLMDARLTMERTLNQEPAQNIRRDDLEICSATLKDMGSIQAIARTAFYYSRFYADPGFSRQHCNDLYALWIEKSFADPCQLVLAARMEGQVAGFITAGWHEQNDSSGKIGLLGVSEGMRGRGIGQFLMDGCLAQLAQRGIKKVEAVTQMRNIGAQRVNQRAGFITSAVQLWYHKWFEVKAVQ